MSGSKRNESNIGVRRQRAYANPSVHTTNQINPSQFSNTGQKHVHLKQTGRTVDTYRGQYRAQILKSQSRPDLQNSQEDEDEDSRSAAAQSLVLSPKTYRRTIESDLNTSSYPQPTTLLLNPEYNLLPVAKGEQSRSVFDFYVNSYATSIIEVSPTNVQSFALVIHQILHDELLFTACTTTSEAARWRTQSLYADPPLSVVRAYGKTIQLFQQRLRSGPYALTNMAILVMGQLTAIESLIKNTSATARHLAGLNMVMSARRGAPPIQSSEGIQSAVDVWTEYFSFREIITNTIPKFEPPTYPRHPFNPKLSMQVADLPPGFNDTVLSGRVSIEVLDMMGRFSKYYQRLAEMTAQGVLDSRERTTLIVQTAGYCIENLQRRLLSVVERFILVALLAHVVRRDRVHPFLVNIRNYFQICCGYLDNVLSSPTDSLHHEDVESDLLKWIGVLLLLTSNPEAHARKLALKILPKKPVLMPVLKTCQQFFWDEDLTNTFLSGKTLIANSSNDIVAEEVQQDLATAKPEKGLDTESGSTADQDETPAHIGDRAEYLTLLRSNKPEIQQARDAGS